MEQKHRVNIIKNEQPRIGWVFLDVEGNLPLVAWECYRGIILPAKCYLDIGIPPLSLWFATMLQNLNSIEIKNEFRLENIRATSFPEKISRLTGFFHFSDKLMATKFAKKHGNSQNHFHDEFLAEAGFDPLMPYSIHDAEWITYYRGINSIDQNWMIQYWLENPCPSAIDGPIWESLTYTPAIIYGTELRNRAYKRIAEEFPNSLGMLELSRLAATGGFMAGHSLPYIYVDNSSYAQVVFLLREAEFRHSDFLDYIMKYNGPKNTKDFNQDSKLITPDFRPYYFKIDANIKDLNRYYFKKL